MTFYKVELKIGYNDKSFMYKDLDKVGVLLRHLIEGSTEPVEITVDKVEKEIKEGE